MAQGSGQHIVVIGGGIVGLAAAEALIRDGNRVTVIEPGAFGGDQAASYGNGAFISPASVIPMSAPGLWAQVPRYLLDRSGPLTIRWPYLPRLLPWLIRFLLAGWTQARVTRTARALASLLDQAPARHGDLAARVGVAGMIRSEGLLYLYTDRTAFEADGLSWRLRALCGVQTRQVEGAELARLAPGLADRYTLGVLLPEGRHCTDPGGYVAAIAHHCAALGMTHAKAHATGLTITDGRLRAVETDQGPIPCDRAVIAAGIGSRPLARRCGNAIPLEAERGYHVELPEAPLDLTIPVMPQDLKVAIVRTAGGLRVAGQVEFASASAAPDWRRADILRDKLIACFPGLGRDGKTGPVKRWQGNRPSTPDGLPVIGAARACPDVLYAFGHGHIGLNSAPMTGQLIADLVAGRPPAIDLAPFSPTRFG